MRLVGLSAMVRVTREFAALDRNSSILPATVLLNGTPAKEVATPLPMSADRQTVEKSIKPPGVKSAPPMWKASGEKGRPLLSTSTDGVAGSAGGATEIGSQDREKIHKPAWSEIRPADVEGERRKGPPLVVDLDGRCGRLRRRCHRGLRWSGRRRALRGNQMVQQLLLRIDRLLCGFERRPPWQRHRRHLRRRPKRPHPLPASVQQLSKRKAALGN